MQRLVELPGTRDGRISVLLLEYEPMQSLEQSSRSRGTQCVRIAHLCMYSQLGLDKAHCSLMSILLHLRGCVDVTELPHAGTQMTVWHLLTA